MTTEAAALLRARTRSGSRDEPVRRPERSRLAMTVAVALLLHLGVVAGLDPSALWPKSTRPRSKPVQALSMTPALRRSLEANRAAMHAATRPESAGARPPVAPPPQASAGQIVDLPAAPASPPPDRARFLADHDSRAAKETRSRHQRKDYGTPAAEPVGAGGKSEQPPVAKAEAARARREDTRAAPPEPALAPPVSEERDHLALKLDPGLVEVLNRRPRPGAAQEAETQPPSEAQSTPTTEGGGPASPLAGVPGMAGAPSNDLLAGLEEGEGTFLNARAFKYATFFNRLKRAVNEQWRPQPRGYPRSGASYWHTGVTIVLARDGSVKHVEVDSPSGDESLDRAAIAAFQYSQPYPNPPHGLVDPNGEIVFHYGFYVFGGAGRRF